MQPFTNVFQSGMGSLMHATGGLRTLAFLFLLTACQVGNASQEPDTVSTDHPGAASYALELRQQLAEALSGQGADYVPRTHHLDAEGRPLYTNRLILEDSPYLLQHAHNPVDWYAWGPEAFERARQEDKPIFLSIGYSTCHWCHVMERESFEDEAIARLLNEHFVCIKIDREQRPDIDEIYMTAVQLLTERGGWPMSSFLTSDGKPFFAGTYFPPDHFNQLLHRIVDAWRSERGSLTDTANRLAAAVQQATAARGAAKSLGDEIFDSALQNIVQRHDTSLGGFGRAPKFPHEPELLFLLSQVWRRGDAKALQAASHSLDAMARGGMYDQVGGGFHRYSVDAQWLVPHFEKMLYNQAHLSRAYTTAHQLTGNPFFERVARQTLDYVLKEMTSPGGGFYSATDADSEGEEGVFFVWTPDQLRDALPAEDAALAIELWSVQPGGNFEGHSILFLEQPLETFAEAHNRPLDELLAQVDRIRASLWQVREQREHPLRDDKILTAWNGMMITTLAQASMALDEPRYAAAAEGAATFLWQHNLRDDGRLWRAHLDGRSSVPALQEDYAYLAEAFVALYDGSRERIWLERARALVQVMMEDFWDAAAGGFFMGPSLTDPPLIARPKSPNDGATPSGNSVAVRTLAQLSRRLEDPSYAQHAEATAAAFGEQMAQFPHGYGYLLTGLDELLRGAVGPLGYGAAGHLRAQATARRQDDGSLSIEVEASLDDGWHINSASPRQDHFQATRLLMLEDRGPWRVTSIDRPAAVDIDVAFEDQPMSVYSGTVDWQVNVRIEPQTTVTQTTATQATVPQAPVAVLELHFQACDDQRCLKPEVLALEVPMAGVVKP